MDPGEDHGGQGLPKAWHSDPPKVGVSVFTFSDLRKVSLTFSGLNGNTTKHYRLYIYIYLKLKGWLRTTKKKVDLIPIGKKKTT